MQCNYCERRCNIAENKSGICQAYTFTNDEIQEEYPFHWTSMGVSHIESIPFYHIYPGSRSLLIGSIGCNFDCSYCSNSYVAKENPEKVFKYTLKPEQVVSKCRQLGCHNIVFAINEPVMSLPSLLELSRVCKRNHIEMGCLSNGYMTEESAKLMADIFSFINISLKGMSSEFYLKYTGAPTVEPVLRNIEYFYSRIHLEMTTPIIQTVNDRDIPAITSFIKKLDPAIPWHVFRLLPEYHMKEMEYPAINEINIALQGAREQLDYIYFSNFVGSDWVSTICPECGKMLIERISLGGCGGKVINYCLDDTRPGSCPACGHSINVKGGKISWEAGEGLL